MISVFKGRSLILVFLSSIVLFGIVVLRHELYSHSHKVWLFGLPLEAIIYLFMAFDAEGKESMKLHRRKFEYLYYLLWALTGFYVYTLLNERLFPIELIYGVVSIFMMILNKWTYFYLFGLSFFLNKYLLFEKWISVHSFINLIEPKFSLQILSVWIWSIIKIRKWTEIISFTES